MAKPRDSPNYHRKILWESGKPRTNFSHKYHIKKPMTEARHNKIGRLVIKQRDPINFSVVCD